MTWEESLAVSAALLNDPLQESFTNAVMLPYLNLARSELQESFELNNIPVTNETSAIIPVPAGTIAIGYPPDPPLVGTPYLPDDLIEIQELYESQTDQNNWIPLTKKNFLTTSTLGNTELSIFGVWAWMDQEIRVLSALTAIDLKIDYIKSLFATLEEADLADIIEIRNIATFLQYRVAGLSAEFVSEDLQRAGNLNSFAAMSIERSLGISVKGQQSIVTRRRPFRASWKRRGILT